MSGTIDLHGSLAVIGGGKMGEAIVRGLVTAGALAATDIVVAEPVADRRAEFETAHAVRAVESAREAVSDATVVLVCVKPQVIDAVVADFAAVVGDALVVSIAVGVTTGRLEALLPSGTAIVRVMPNTPAMVGEAMSVISGGSEASAEDVELVRELFSAIGQAEVLDEQHQDAAAAISGSGPAYMALVIDALARAGVRQGLPRDVAQRLAVQTMLGTAEMIAVSGQHPEALIDAVTSPGGTTIAALEALEDGGVRAAFNAAVAAAVARAKELG